MEAMWSRFLPKTAAVRNWIAEGRIGRVNLMQATIGWKADITYNKRLFLPELGGGALYDIGVYPLELLPYFVNQKIVGLQPLMKRCDTGVDDISSLNLMLEGCFANIQCSFTTKLPEDVYIYGEEGYIKSIMETRLSYMGMMINPKTILKEAWKMDLYMKQRR